MSINKLHTFNESLWHPCLKATPFYIVIGNRHAGKLNTWHCLYIGLKWCGISKVDFIWFKYKQIIHRRFDIEFKYTYSILWNKCEYKFPNFGELRDLIIICLIICLTLQKNLILWILTGLFCSGFEIPISQMRSNIICLTASQLEWACMIFGETNAGWKLT